MGIRVESSYDSNKSNTQSWLKGNLHAHTTESDGRRTPQEVVDDYAARGYDFLMISDHDKLTDPNKLSARGLTLIPGNEVSAKGPHLLHVNAKTRLEPDADRQKVLTNILEEKSFAVINHPNWQEGFNHCPQENLNAWKEYAGIEIYNGVIRRLYGSPLATDRWDMLLTAGRKVWGFGNDDSHDNEDVELAWNVVQSPSRSVTDIFEAMKRGAFYASTGATFSHISLQGRTIHVKSPDAQRIVLNGDYGRRLKQVDSQEFTFHVPEDIGQKYLRIEIYGKGEDMAWTQPFFIQKG